MAAAAVAKKECVWMIEWLRWRWMAREDGKVQGRSPAGRCRGLWCADFRTIQSLPGSGLDVEDYVYYQCLQQVCLFLCESTREGNKAFKEGNVDLAIRLYSEGIEEDPNNFALYSNRSMALARQERWQEAASDGIRCVDLNPGFMKGFHRAGHALQRLGRYGEAVKILERGLAAHPGNADLRSLLEEARSQFERHEAERRSRLRGPEKLKEEGNDLFKAARFELAVEKYTEALGAVADRQSDLAITILNNRAACYKQLGDFEGVIRDTSEVIEVEPDNVKALLRRALALEGMERFRFALADVRHVLSLDPTVEIAKQAQHRIGRHVRELKAQDKAANSMPL